MKETIQQTTNWIKKQADETIVKNYKASKDWWRDSPFISSITAVAVLLVIFLGVGVQLDILTPYSMGFAVLFAVLAWLGLVGLRKGLKDARTSVMEEIPRVKNWRNVALVLIIVSYLLGVIYLIERIPVPEKNLEIALFWVVFTLIAVGGLVQLLRIITDGDNTARDMAHVGVVFGALLVAWSLASISYSLVNKVTVSHTETESSLKTVVDNRKKAQGEYPGVTVAVALSGGGYRAATIHAGVLKALEGNAIPIHYLSTVSGGSIIGAYYALGHTPEKFIGLLGTKPGLANDLFHIWNVGTELVGPQSMRDSDIYADHFRRVCFGAHTLSDVTNPTLIVNATRYTDRSRFVFSPGRTPHIELANAVAASGAFPGAFEPKRVAVPMPDGRTDEFQEFIDGGVVENLGLEGLREYPKPPNSFKETDPKNTSGTCRAGLPDVLIVSDASKADKDPRVKSKELRLTLLKEASPTSYLALHQKRYRLFTNNKYEPNMELIPGAPSPQPFFQGYQHLFEANDEHECYLFTFVLDGTTKAESKYMKGTPADEVAKFDTLKELSGGEVAMGVTVGETIAKKYLPAIQCVLNKIKIKKSKHERIDDPNTMRQECSAEVRVEREETRSAYDGMITDAFAS